MRIRTLYLIIILFLSSCKEEDNFQWNLERTSHNDGRLKVSELINTINCSNLNQFTDTLSIWNRRYIDENGLRDSCICLIPGLNQRETAVNLSIKNSEDCVLRFYYRVSYPAGGADIRIKVNSKTLNFAIIQGNVNSTDWCQVQTALIRKGNNHITLSIIQSEYGYRFIDEIELWKPKIY